MSESTPATCCCPPEAGSAACELPSANGQRQAHVTNLCPECGEAGKKVQGQTVKALLAVSLRAVRAEVTYLFCTTPTCVVVYFTPDGAQTFMVNHVRERVYQKEPDANEVLVCYCFRYTVGDVRATAPPQRLAMIADINAGIEVGQCACDLRNPQGSCCLGNVRGLIKRVKRTQPAKVVAH